MSYRIRRHTAAGATTGTVVMDSLERAKSVALAGVQFYAGIVSADVLDENGNVVWSAPCGECRGTGVRVIGWTRYEPCGGCRS